MRNARFKRQPDDSVLVQLMTDNGPCDLLSVDKKLLVTQFVNCPKCSVFELIGVLVQASEVQLMGKP